MVFAGKVVPVICLLIITVIYSRKLGYEDYGKYQALWVLISLCGTLLLFGLPSILLSSPGGGFMPWIKKQRKQLGLTYASLLVLSLAICWLGADAYTLQEKILLCVLLLLQSISIVMDTRLIKLDLLKPYILINIGYAACFLALHLYVLQGPFSLYNLMLMLAGLLCIKLLVSMLVKAPGQPGIASTTTLSVSHWLYTGLNEVSGIIGRWLDKIVLIYLLTASEFAIYFNGSFEIPLFAVLVSAMENVMLANISRHIEDKKNALSVFRESFKILSLIAFPVFSFFLFAHKEFYGIIFQHKYDASIAVFVVSLFLIPLRITHYGVILMCYGKGKQLLIGSIADILLALLLMLVLYPFFGTLGVMLALVISTYLQVIYYLIVSSRILNVKAHQLVPINYLLTLMAVLMILFYGLSFTREWMSEMGYLLLLFAAASIIVCAGLFHYFRKKQQLL